MEKKLCVTFPAYSLKNSRKAESRKNKTDEPITLESDEDDNDENAAKNQEKVMNKSKKSSATKTRKQNEKKKPNEIMMTLIE